MEKLLVCYGDLNNVKILGLYFKVHWKGYGSSEDTWEPLDGLSDCKEVLKYFVERGYKKLLPLSGDADFTCRGPSCQGVGGFNRFRKSSSSVRGGKKWAADCLYGYYIFSENKYVLMENVVDILKFGGCFLGRYAIGPLVAMNYQVRMGLVAVGSYSFPQFCLCVFLWGDHPNEKLPSYPLPTHETEVFVKCISE